MQRLLLCTILALPILALPPASAGHEICPLDVSLVLDRSGSMTGDKMAFTKLGARYFVSFLSPEDQSGLASFSTTATHNKHVDAAHGATDAAIAALAAGGNTAIGDGIAVGHTDMLAHARFGAARTIMVVLSDGDNNEGQDPIIAANAAKGAGIEVFSISVQGANPAVMAAIASPPLADHFYQAATAAEIYDAFDAISLYVHRLCASWGVEPACAGRPTQFHDQSRVRAPTAITESRWDWGDGSGDVFMPPEPAPQHTYATWGWRSVTLEVWDSAGAYDIVTRDVLVPACPVAAFSCVPLGHPDYLTIRFTDMSSDADGTIVRWQWDLAEAGASDAQHPTARYAGPGWITVTLTVWDDDGHMAAASGSCYADLNLPPVIDPIPLHVVYEGDLVAFPVTGRDLDDPQDPTRFTWSPAALLGHRDFSFNGGANLFGDNLFQWQTRRGDAGTYTLGFAIHEWQFSDATDATIVVLPLPDPPAPRTLDADGDGRADQEDNCPFVVNPDQLDADDDGVGDACQPSHAAPGLGPSEPGAPPLAPTPPVQADADGDGTADAADVCPMVPDDQADVDRDGRGDACDDDRDGDGVPELREGLLLDNCPYTPNPDQADRDGDGAGDACQGDRDGDGVPDGADPCPWTRGPCAAVDPLGPAAPSPAPSDARAGGPRPPSGHDAPWAAWAALAVLAGAWASRRSV